jgi:hypothetical protein
MEHTGSPTTQRDALPAIPAPPPPPPPAPQVHRPIPVIPAEPGQLTLGWRIATAIVWGLVFVAYIAVWKTSRELGLSTWWLGPLGEPVGWYVSMLPFLVPIAMILLAVNNAKGLPWFGLVGAAWCAVIGLLDTGKVWRLGLVELGIAVAAGLAAVGSISGRLRPLRRAETRAHSPGVNP